jgi:hypothetical protein
VGDFRTKQKNGISIYVLNIRVSQSKQDITAHLNTFPERLALLKGA